MPTRGTSSVAYYFIRNNIVASRLIIISYNNTTHTSGANKNANFVYCNYLLMLFSFSFLQRLLKEHKLFSRVASVIFIFVVYVDASNIPPEFMTVAGRDERKQLLKFVLTFFACNLFTISRL